MKKAAWVFVMLAALLVTGGAGYYLVTQMNAPKPATKPVEPVTPPITQNAPAEPVKAEKPPETVQEPAKAPVATTRNILFRFPRPSAKAVFIVGDFNNWKRQPMVKKEKGWDISVPLEPGAYKYMFVVDGRRIRDPNNRVVQEGKSLINVKPL